MTIFLLSFFFFSGDIARPEEAVSEAERFIRLCYGHADCATMTEARYQAWTQKVTKAIAKAPKLESLPPTSEAFRENVLRANLQVFIWSKAHLPFLPHIDPVSHGWVWRMAFTHPAISQIPSN